MADIAASTKLGQGFGQVAPVLGVKVVCVSFATTATGDVLIFDQSNVGRENSLSKIVWANVVTATGAFTSLIIASNQITVGSDQGAAATACVAFVAGIGG